MRLYTLFRGKCAQQNAHTFRFYDFMQIKPVKFANVNYDGSERDEKQRVIVSESREDGKRRQSEEIRIYAECEERQR